MTSDGWSSAKPHPGTPSSVPTEPTWSDAWILMALVLGAGDVRNTIGSADYMNHAIPTDAEWVHACTVLAPRGLIVGGGPLPAPTEDARTLVLSHRPWHTSFAPIAERLRTMKIVCSEPCAPPERSILQKG